jgi:simple sugar transport system substrate-binding protein
VIGDKSSLDKGFLLTSVLWDLTPVYSAMIEDLRADSFGTKHYRIQLADNSLRLLRTKNVQADVWESVMKIRDDVIAGRIKVDATFDAAAVRALMTDINAASPR